MTTGDLEQYCKGHILNEIAIYFHPFLTGGVISIVSIKWVSRFSYDNRQTYRIAVAYITVSNIFHGKKQEQYGTGVISTYV